MLVSQADGDTLNMAVAVCEQLIARSVHGRGAVRFERGLWAELPNGGWQAYILQTDYAAMAKLCDGSPISIGVHIWNPVEDWSLTGPIMDREKIAPSYDAGWVYDPENVDPEDEPDNGDRWYAEIRKSSHEFVSAYGPTALVAILRCYVIARLGDIELKEVT